jgi:translation initiation factor 1
MATVSSEKNGAVARPRRSFIFSRPFDEALAMPGLSGLALSQYAIVSGPKRIPTDGGQSLSHNPFAALSSEGLPGAPADLPSEPASPGSAKVKSAHKNRGRVDIIRQKAGRGGKTVTVVKNFVGIGLPEKEQLAKAMQKACGTGGTVKDGQIEIQGDKREEVARILTAANFRPVFAGG